MNKDPQILIDALKEAKSAIEWFNKNTQRNEGVTLQDEHDVTVGTLDRIDTALTSYAGAAESVTEVRGNWIKASDRLPTVNDGIVILKIDGKHRREGVWSTNENAFIVDEGRYPPTLYFIEWLDERRASEGEKEPSPEALEAAARSRKSLEHVMSKESPVKDGFLPILQENLQAMIDAKRKGYNPDEIFNSNNPYDIVIEVYEDMIAVYNSRLSPAEPEKKDPIKVQSDDIEVKCESFRADKGQYKMIKVTLENVDLEETINFLLRSRKTADFIESTYAPEDFFEYLMFNPFHELSKFYHEYKSDFLEGGRLHHFVIELQYILGAIKSHSAATKQENP